MVSFFFFFVSLRQTLTRNYHRKGHQPTNCTCNFITRPRLQRLANCGKECQVFRFIWLEPVHCNRLRARSHYVKQNARCYVFMMLSKFVFWSAGSHFHVNANSNALERKPGSPREYSRKRKRSQIRVQKCDLSLQKKKKKKN